MKRSALLLLGFCLALALTGCAAPTRTKAPTAPAAQDVQSLFLDQLRTLSPEEAQSRKDQWGIPGIAVACVGAGAGEATVLACQWGPGYNAMFDGRLLVWREKYAWKSQPYPAEAVRGVGYFVRLYRGPEELIVIMNVARGMTMGTEQVQVLRPVGSGWQVGWLPDENVWTKGHATVTFTDNTYSSFNVETDSYGLPDEERGPFAESNAGEHRPFREEWQRSGVGYERTARVEIPSEYGALVHFITALKQGDLAAAQEWAASPDVVRLATELGIGAVPDLFLARREGGSTFRLIAVNDSETPQWRVWVVKSGDRWAVSDIEGPPYEVRAWETAACDPPVDKVTVGDVQDKKVEDRLLAILREDQAVRQGGNIDFKQMALHDATRRAEVVQYLAEGQVASGRALFVAAMVFQHGNCSEHYQLANQLAGQAIERGEGQARWLYAATLDRYLLSQGKPQKFGTQYRVVGEKWDLLPFDPETTDAERAKFDVPPLSEAKSISMPSPPATGR